jgi:hypothetical protein
MAKEIAATLPVPAVSTFRLSRIPYLLCLAFALTIFGGWWMKQAEVIVLASQITEAVPPIPALGALLLLLLVNPILKRLSPPLALSRSEMLLVYAFCTIATAVPACGSLRFVLSLTTFPIYYERMQPTMRMDLITPHIPDWLVPKEFAVIRDLYQGRPDAKVPWDVWAVPIASWTLFFAVYWLALTGILCVFEKRWREHERLVFPAPLPSHEGDRRKPAGRVAKVLARPIDVARLFALGFLQRLEHRQRFLPTVSSAGQSFWTLGNTSQHRP